MTFPSDELEKETRHAFLREDTKHDDVSGVARLPLRVRQRNALDESGWEIQVDPRSGLILREVSDFFPEIESDPDHGIDWFRFDVTGEANGKRFSLVPHIARAIREGILENLSEAAEAGEFTLIQCENPEDGFVRFPTERFLEICQQVGHLFQDGTRRMGRFAWIGWEQRMWRTVLISIHRRRRAPWHVSRRNLREMHHDGDKASCRRGSMRSSVHYQMEGFSWLQFLAENGLHGVLADDMGLGKTLQTLTHLCAEAAKKPGRPSLVIAPTSVVPNWASEAEKFVPGLRVVTFHGSERAKLHEQIPDADIVLTSYPLLARDIDVLSGSRSGTRWCWTKLSISRIPRPLSLEMPAS